VAQAIKTKDLHDWVEKKAQIKTAQTSLKAFRDKSFEQLSADDKDKLLKTIALQMKLIKASE
jgi:hypothetical protein